MVHRAAEESRWLKREVVFAFARAEADYSRAYQEDYRVGGGGTVGLLADLTDRWKLDGLWNVLALPIG